MSNPERHEDYFWERYQTLARTEEDSDLRQILSGVGPIKTFSDVRAVLQMYDDKAEKVKPNYWERRFTESVALQRDLGLLDEINVSVYSENGLSPSVKFLRTVLNMEKELADECKDVTERILNGGQI